MTIPTWPSELPNPERSSYRNSRQEVRLKRNPEAGPPSYRRRFSGAAKTVALSIVVDRDLVGMFNRFYDEQTEAGSNPFYMPDPTTDGWPLLTSAGSPLLLSDGTPILLGRRWLCLFGDSVPEDTAVSGLEFRINFSVVVMP